MTNLTTQRQWIISQLLENGQISRNKCLSNYISRLSGHIHAIKEKNPHWDILGKTIPTQHGGEDYVYFLTNKNKVKSIGV
ncbi:hypothetical protein CFT13S00388_07880 [Campylobacter fetus subsp. testudinum]|uniref:hypothetical protein n=1 Tax=Campylobacter fetus TaxID=196 RepID=UPI000818C4F0|nr:hypothetical protein [Campylobacter fetus]OCR86670.1 hypothetical protein CFT13S00388_07880 [Campylobacter fetus subsp. testudinum]